MNMKMKPIAFIQEDNSSDLPLNYNSGVIKRELEMTPFI